MGETEADWWGGGGAVRKGFAVGLQRVITAAERRRPAPGERVRENHLFYTWRRATASGGTSTEKGRSGGREEGAGQSTGRASRAGQPRGFRIRTQCIRRPRGAESAQAQFSGVGRPARKPAQLWELLPSARGAPWGPRMPSFQWLEGPDAGS